MVCRWENPCFSGQVAPSFVNLRRYFRLVRYLHVGIKQDTCSSDMEPRASSPPATRGISTTHLLLSASFVDRPRSPHPAQPCACSTAATPPPPHRRPTGHTTEGIRTIRASDTQPPFDPRPFGILRDDLRHRPSPRHASIRHAPAHRRRGRTSRRRIIPARGRYLETHTEERAGFDIGERKGRSRGTEGESSRGTGDATGGL